MSRNVGRLAPNDRGKDLYIVQAETGFIKVGRSDDAAKRVQGLQAAQACAVALLHVAPGLGPEETELLKRLAGRRVRGEWFDGTLAARDIIEGFLGVRLHWPYATPTARTDGADDSDPSFLTAKNAAALVGVSLPAFWKSVAQEILPAPFYPARRAPRWSKAELLAALERTRKLPREAKWQRMTVRRANLSKDRRNAELGVEGNPE
jgi:predicted DNA-binding transcriptional regulator AlpA